MRGGLIYNTYSRPYTPGEIEAEIAEAGATEPQQVSKAPLVQPDKEMSLAAFAELPSRYLWSLIGTELSISTSQSGTVINTYDLYFRSPGWAVLRVNAVPDVCKHPDTITCNAHDIDAYIDLVNSGHYKIAAACSFRVSG